MALKINTTLKSGVVATEAYAKIIKINYLPARYPAAVAGIGVVVAFYFNKAARDADQYEYIEARDYLIEDMTKESREDQYTYLKTLDDFSGATDV
jgi:hypothetical protein